MFAVVLATTETCFKYSITVKVFLLAISPEIISFTLSPTGKFQPRQRGSLRFRCSTRAATRIDFMRNGVILLNSNDRRLSRSGNFLSISNLDYSRDDGIYRCRASNSRGTVLSVPINLKVAGNRNLLTVIRPSNGYLPAQRQNWKY